MRIAEGKEEEYRDWRAKNEPNDEDRIGYGMACFAFAERWAEDMERAIDAAPGASVAEVLSANAEQAGRRADTDGITGFMYGMAVSILAQCWKYGEDLRRWHNLDTQIGDEGKKANKSGGVLNPAILSIG